MPDIGGLAVSVLFHIARTSDSPQAAPRRPTLASTPDIHALFKRWMAPLELWTGFPSGRRNLVNLVVKVPLLGISLACGLQQSLRWWAKGLRSGPATSATIVLPSGSKCPAANAADLAERFWRKDPRTRRVRRSRLTDHCEGSRNRTMY
jgi:hypothetical protein